MEISVRNAAILTGLVGGALAANGFGIAGAISIFAALAAFILMPHNAAFDSSPQATIEQEEECDPELLTYDDWLDEQRARKAHKNSLG